MAQGYGHRKPTLSRLIAFASLALEAGCLVQWATSPTGGAGVDRLGCRAPRRFVGWQTFFDFGDGEVKPNKKIDTKISTTLFNLPLAAIASHDGPTSLPQRNLLRHLTWQLPSGQRIARAVRRSVRREGRGREQGVTELGVGQGRRLSSRDDETRSKLTAACSEADARADVLKGGAVRADEREVAALLARVRSARVPRA